MKNLIRIAALAIALAACAAHAATGPEIRYEPAPINRLDTASLQRGARNFGNYCLNCHSAKFMRYNRLTDLGLTDEQIRDNLILTGAKLGDPMTVAMRAADAKAWFGTPPPDLSVEARVRGSDWLYNYLIGFYKDDKSTTGWNNLVFDNVGMPNVLWQLQGVNRLVEKEYDGHHEAQAAAIAAKQLSLTAPAKDDKFVVKTLAQETAGTMSPREYQTFVADLVNYLTYMAEPARNQRIEIGLAVMLYLGVLFVFAYWLKREVWKDLH